jgi:hypothetical protein
MVAAAKGFALAWWAARLVGQRGWDEVRLG